MKYKAIKQHDIKDCGAACLSMICLYYGLELPLCSFRELVKTDSNGTSIYGIIEGAKKMGLDASALEGNPDEFINEVKKGNVIFPLIAKVIVDGVLEHFVVIYKIKNNNIYIGDSINGKVKKMTLDIFYSIWSGHIIIFEKNNFFKAENKNKNKYTKFLFVIATQIKFIIIAILISLMISIIAILSSFSFQYIIDDILTKKLGLPKLNIFCISLCLLYCLQIIFENIRGLCLTKVNVKIDTSLIENSYNHMIKLPMTFFGNLKTGEILTRFDDTSKIRDALSSTALTLILNSFVIIICGSILFFKNKILFLCALLMVLIHTIIIIYYLNPLKKANQELMKNNAEYYSYLKESVDGIEMIKSLKCEDFIKETANIKVKNFIASNANYALKKIREESFINGVSSIGIIILLWLGTRFVINGKMTLGELMMSFSLITFIISPIKGLIGLQPVLSSAQIAADRLNDILESKTELFESEIKVPNISLKKNIYFNHVNFKYGNRELVINDLNLEIKKGNKIAIVGKSGCGKTTLAKLLMRFYDVTSGEIKFGELNINDYPLEIIRNKVGYISQNNFFFSDTIKNNLTLGNPNITDKDIWDALKMTCSEEFIKNMPYGIDSLLEENATNLSGGQKQRLSIARTLLKKPDILIMDEITSNLDIINENNIKNMILNISQDVTCIIITHRLYTVRDCDLIIVMDSGNIIEMGSHNELLQKHGEYCEFIGT